jgi:hypothetical protein
MSDSKNQTRYTGIDRRTPRSEPGVAKPGVAAPREAYKTGGRHAAITNPVPRPAHNFANRAAWR